MDDTLQTYVYAGFWRRLVAILIDGIIWTLIAGIMGVILGLNFFVSISIIPVLSDFLISYALPFIATIACWHYWQATPGKILMKIKIIDVHTGEKPTLGQFVGRYLGYIVSAIFLLAGFIWVAFDEKKQGWHDKLAKTAAIMTDG